MVNIEKVQKLASLAVATNIPNISPKFFCRKSSDPKDEQVLVDQFIDHLNDIYNKYLELLPDFIETGIEKLESMLQVMKFSTRKTELTTLLTHLKSYRQLRIFAFNGGKSLKLKINFHLRII